MYNINGVFVLLGVLSGFFTSAKAQSVNTSEIYKKNYEKARKLRHKYPDSTKIFANRALLSASNNDQRAEVYCLLGKMAKAQEWNNTAIHYYQQSLKLYTNETSKNKVRLAMIAPYRRQKKYNTALRLARWVTKHAEKKGELGNLKNSYSSLGNVFYNLSQADTFSIKWIDSSLHYHRKSIELRKKYFPRTQAMAYYNSSFAYEAISPDSAIHYTQLALQQPNLETYHKALYNIRLAQIYYKKKAFKFGKYYLNKAQQIHYQDLNLQNMYWFYKAMIALFQQNIREVKQGFNKYDSVISLLRNNAQNMADQKGLTEMIREDYQDACNAAMQMYKRTKNEVYLGLINQYKIKKQQASKKYIRTHLLIEKQDSLLLSKVYSTAELRMTKPTLETQLSNENTQRWIFWGIMIILIMLGGIVWWYQLQQKQAMPPPAEQPQLMITNQKLNTKLLSSLAEQNEFEKILSLLNTHLGNDTLKHYTQNLPNDVTLSAQEKVYLKLLSEGFSQWEIGQMLNKNKRSIIEWDKKLKQKLNKVQ